MRYRVINITEKVIVLTTEDEKLARDYYEQCVRASERFEERATPEKPVRWVFETLKEPK